jgi:DtxR family Mn-dependent transcriptional regulator
MKQEKPCKIMADSGTEQSLYEDEVLETIWEMRERSGAAAYDALLAEVGEEGRLKRMGKEHALFFLKEGMVVLTDDGECRARDIIRRHRLAERLFNDVLDIKDFEADACRLEHALSPEAEDAICTFLGHPPRCPHGKEIPRGKCCAVFTRKVKPLVQSLKDAEVGKEVRVLFINIPSIDRLAAMGLVPGAVVHLQQKRPSFVLDIDETTIAIDEDIAGGIYVKQM